MTTKDLLKAGSIIKELSLITNKKKYETNLVISLGEALKEKIHSEYLDIDWNAENIKNFFLFWQNVQHDKSCIGQNVFFNLLEKVKEDYDTFDILSLFEIAFALKNDFPELFEQLSLVFLEKFKNSKRFDHFTIYELINIAKGIRF